MTSLVTNTSSPCAKTATFNGRANIQDITNPLAPISVDGNATLQVKMTDAGEPGSSDRLAITVWNKNGGVWFSSNWNGTTTVEQLLGGGNLKVHGGANCANNPTTRSMTGTELFTTPAVGGMIVKAFPNPSQSQFTLTVENGSIERVQVKVYDGTGKLVKRMERSDRIRVFSFGEELKAGAYLVEVIQGQNRKTLTVTKQ